MSFLDKYEDVATRIKRLHATHPTNRVETSIVEFNAVAGYILVECRIFREFEDEKPSAIDYAFGRIESYNTQMKRWFVEDTVTSAIGRCVGLLLGSDDRPTLQNMQQVETMPAKFVNAEVEDLWAKPFGEVTITATTEEGFATASQAIGEIQTQLGGVLIAEAPKCAHGHRVWRTGTSAKNGKAWANYSCTEKSKATQCTPLWYVLASDGQWKPQV